MAEGIDGSYRMLVVRSSMARWTRGAYCDILIMKASDASGGNM